jgi:hypothetical protein
MLCSGPPWVLTSICSSESHLSVTPFGHTMVTLWSHMSRGHTLVWGHVSRDH